MPRRSHDVGVRERADGDGLSERARPTANTVSFTFDTPKTHQPRDDLPQLVSVVRAADQQIVAAYDSLGLASNDPNTVGDQAAATIGRSFAIYGEQFFARRSRTWRELSASTLQSAVRTLTDAFQIALDAASQFVTNAGYTLSLVDRRAREHRQPGVRLLVRRRDQQSGALRARPRRLRDRERQLGGGAARSGSRPAASAASGCTTRSQPSTAPTAGPTTRGSTRAAGAKCQGSRSPTRRPPRT